MNDPATLDHHDAEQPTYSKRSESSYIDASPKLTQSALTTTLIAMCVVPVLLIILLFAYLPQVHEGELEAAIAAEGLPPAAFYEQRYDLRPKVPSGYLVVHNQSDEDWTHLNIQVNRHYQIYDREPIPAGETRKFKLNRFITRTGAAFELRYNPLKFVRIYARKPTKDRATFASDFDWESVNE